MRLRLLVAGIVGAVMGAGVVHFVGDPRVGDLRSAAFGFDGYVRSARLGVRQRCGAAGWHGERERALSGLVEQEAAFNFAVNWMHAYDTPVARDFDRIAKDMKALRAELEALRCD